MTHRYEWTATSGTMWIDGQQTGQITREGSVNQIGYTDWDNCFAGTHDWYLRVTYQYGIGTGADAGGPANPALPPTELWVRDVRIWEPDA